MMFKKQITIQQQNVNFLNFYNIKVPCIKYKSRRLLNKMNGIMDPILNESGNVAVVDVEKYEEHLNNKIKFIESTFSDVNYPNFEIFKSPKQHYRLRSNLI